MMELPEFKNIVDFKKTCRLCLSEKEILAHDLMCLDITVNKNVINVFDLVNRIIGGKLKVDCNHPLKICKECFSIAKAVFKFKLQCESSVFIINEYLNNRFVTEHIILAPIIDDPADTNGNDNHYEHHEDLKPPVEDAQLFTEDIKLSDEDVKVPLIELLISDAIKLDKSAKKPHKPKKIRFRAREVIDPSSLVCKLCNKSFKNKYNLRNHIDRHEGKDLYVCDICKKGFSIKGCLARHFLTAHPMMKEEHDCNECGKIFSTSKKLEMHQRMHTGVRPYLCMLCGKAFSLQTTLSFHVKRHSMPDTFTCELCGKRFQLLANYNRHKFSHTGERPFTCEICGKRLTKKADLHRHISLIHDKSVHFLCSVCGKDFTSSAYRRMHMMRHTNEWKCFCPVCKKGFPRKRELAKHSEKCTFERKEQLRFKKLMKERQHLLKLQRVLQKKQKDSDKERRKEIRRILSERKKNLEINKIKSRQNGSLGSTIHKNRENDNNVVIITRVKQRTVIRRKIRK